MAGLAPTDSWQTAERVAGGHEESIFQPEWSPDGRLYFVSDRTGWWNLYQLDWQSPAQLIETLCEMEAEFGMPQWVFGMSTYAFESAERIVCAYIQKGFSRLALIDTRTKQFEPIDCPYTDMKYVRARTGHAVMRAGSPTEAASIVKLDLATRTFEVLRLSNSLEIDAGYLSTPAPSSFPPKTDGRPTDFFIRPRNRDYRRARRRTAAAVG